MKKSSADESKRLLEETRRMKNQLVQLRLQKEALGLTGYVTFFSTILDGIPLNHHTCLGH